MGRTFWCCASQQVDPVAAARVALCRSCARDTSQVALHGSISQLRAGINLLTSGLNSRQTSRRACVDNSLRLLCFMTPAVISC